jgi:formylglycine-generating enzyme required for sulfatase activity
MTLRHELDGNILGLGALTTLVTFAALWMHLHSRRAPEATTPAIATILARTELARFRTDAWQLPDEPLLGFVKIPKGEFLMGSDPRVDPLAYENERWSNERLRGSVALPTYYIGRYEVTVAQLAVFAAQSGYPLDPAALQAPPDHPATNVSWTDALAYARWLQATLRESPGTPLELMTLLSAGWRITLPSEAEWEKAARSSDGRVYPWGNWPSTEYANFGASGTRAVGSFMCMSCAFGLSDMSGNVWELTRSPFRPYPFDSNDRAIDLLADALYIMRGGSFSDMANNVRAATRGGVDPGARRSFIGFRLVLTPASDDE